MTQGYWIPWKPTMWRPTPGQNYVPLYHGLHTRPPLLVSSTEF